MSETIVSVTDLVFRYPDGRQALHNLSFSVPIGAKVGLIGPNGAGKSTLLQHLNGTLRATSGTLTIAGIPIGTSTLPQIRALVGMVFQQPDDQLFSLRVADDVAFGPLHMGLSPQEVDRRVAHALQQVGMTAFADHNPYHLSVGEKKRVALATVLSMSPRLLALDEPSAGIDPRGRRELIALLQPMPQTMLISSHDMRLVAALCDHILLLDGGHIVTYGAAASILNDAELLDAHGLELP